MPDKLTFLYKDHFKDATITADSEVATLPASNIANPIVDKVYRSGTTGTAHITLDLLSAKSINMISLVNHNFSETGGTGDGITVEANTSEAFADGQLRLEGEIDDGGTYFSVWGDGTYIYAACGGSGIRAYSFNGTTFSLIDTIDEVGQENAVWGDGTYIYAACAGSGIRAYSFNGTTFSLIDTIDDGGTYNGVWGDGTYIYAACGADGIRAYSFNGTTFSLIDTIDDGGPYEKVWGDGTYVYTACGGDGVRAYSFNGTTFSLIDTDFVAGYYYGVWGDGSYIYVAGGASGVRAYSFNGTTFSLIDTQLDGGGNYLGVWGDGTYVYCVGSANGLQAYIFNGTTFSLISEKDDGGFYYGVWGDSTYVYCGCGLDGIRAYAFPRGTPPVTEAFDLWESGATNIGTKTIVRPLLLASLHNYRWWNIKIVDDSNSDGYLQLGVAQGGQYFENDNFYDLNWKHSLVDPSTKRQIGSYTVVDRKYQYNKIDFEVNHIPDTTKEDDFFQMLKEIGVANDFILMLKPTTAAGRSDFTFYGQLEASPVFTKATTNYNNAGFTFKESIGDDTIITE